MIVKEISLEGFKSFSFSITLEDVDPRFNVIVGQNGTGKSNIIDAICFLMGMTTLSNLRVKNLQELIYKSGKAGLSRGTISATFRIVDDKIKEIFNVKDDTVVITRKVEPTKTSYTLNNKAIQAERIKDAFNSMGLNINTPRFLVQQGKISKVIHMKAKELLSMLEETMGTEYYVNKRDSGMRILEKKMQHLKEFDELMESITKPRMDNLRKQFQDLQRYKDNESNIHNYDRIKKAFRFSKLNVSMEIEQRAIDELKEKIEGINNIIIELQTEMKNTETYLRDSIDISNNPTNELINKLKVELENLKKALDELKTSKDSIEVKLQLKTTEKNKILDGIKNLDENLIKYRETEGELNNKIVGIKNSIDFNNEELKRFETIKNTVESNVDNDEKEDTLKIQLSQIENTINQFNLKLNNENEKYSNVTSSLQACETKLNNMVKNYNDKKSRIDLILKEIEKSNDEIKNLDNEVDKEILKKSINDISENLTKNELELENAFQRNPRIYFRYKEPPNFDKSKVYGRVCTLFKVKDERFAFAFEQLLGNKMFDVIVENQETCIQLLKGDYLYDRETLIPTNNSLNFSTQPEVINKQKELFKGKVFNCIDLIEYDKKIEKSIKFLLNNMMISLDSNIAEKIAVPETKIKCATIDGILFDPNGIMQGGKVKDNKHDLMKEASEVKFLMDKRINLMNEINKLKRELESGKDKNTRKQDLLNKISLLEDEKKNIMSGQLTEESKLKATQSSLKQELNELTSNIERIKNQISESDKSYKMIKDTLSQLGQKTSKKIKK